MPQTLDVNALRREKPTDKMQENIDKLSALFRAPKNKDFTERRFSVYGFDVCLLYLEGICGSEELSDWVLRPCFLEAEQSANLPPEQRAQYLKTHALAASQLKDVETFGEICDYLLSGLSCLVIDGCEEIIVMDTRALPQRSVSHTNNESVVLGSQEGFVENLRTNISLVRKNYRNSALITENITIGADGKTNVALMYVDGVTDQAIVAEVRKRIKSISLRMVSGTGQLQQLIEDNPYALFPQILQTERPDRVGAGFSEGQLAILVDNSPYALLGPATIFHFIHASDDTFMRWQYGTFIRIIRILGILFSLLLPGVYIAVTQYHTHLLPMDLLTSIAEARANVPFSILSEILIMEFSFHLINEAGTRIPSQIGSTLGIVGALILGQAAVSASIISPILIIIVALTGLGNFVVPAYSFGIAVEMYRLVILLAGAAYGLYGIVLACFYLGCTLCAMRSFGAPYFAPAAPLRPHNPDLVLRLPLWMQKRLMFFAQKKTGEGA